MDSPIDILRKALSLGISVMLLVVSVAVPLMDRSEMTVELAVESEHDPATCHPGHDHTVCTLVGANAGMALPAHEGRPGHGVLHTPVPADPDAARSGTYSKGPPSRAPPPGSTRPTPA